MEDWIPQAQDNKNRKCEYEIELLPPPLPPKAVIDTPLSHQKLNVNCDGPPATVQQLVESKMKSAPSLPPKPIVYT